MNDWQASLKGFLDNNPDLPEGTDPTLDQPKPEKKPKLHIAIERKGRGGKTATIIDGFPDSMPDSEIAALAGRLKQRLGTGGSARGGEILIQGDRRADLLPLLRAEGYPC